jgi:ribosomal protein L32
MRKLSAEEGAVHLEAQQAAQSASEIHSVEYDVWLDDKTGEKRIEKYMAYQHAEKCGECGYYTMRIDNEEVEKQPSQSQSGLLLKHYKCSYCSHREAREVEIAALSSNA